MRPPKALFATFARIIIFGSASAFNLIVIVYLSANGAIVALATYGLAISMVQLAYGLIGLNLYAPSIAAKSIEDYWLLRSTNIFVLPLIFFALFLAPTTMTQGILAAVMLRTALNCIDIISISMLYKKRLWTAFTISLAALILAVLTFLFFGELGAFAYVLASLGVLYALLFGHIGIHRVMRSLGGVYRDYYWNGIIAFQMSGQNAFPRIVLAGFGPEYVALHVQLTSLIAPVSLLTRSLNFDILRNGQATLAERSLLFRMLKRQFKLFAVICSALFILLSTLIVVDLFPYPGFGVWDISFGVAAILFTSIGGLVSGFLKIGGLAREEFFLLVATLGASCLLFVTLPASFGEAAVAPALALASLITTLGRLAVIVRAT
jgi:hypothetical protein